MALIRLIEFLTDEDEKRVHFGQTGWPEPRVM